MTPMIAGHRFALMLLTASVALVAAGCGQAPAKVETPGAVAPPAATTPSAPPAVRVFVTNEASGDLSVIDAATQTVIATAPLGKRPRGIKASADGKTLYVALSGSPNAGPGVDPKTLPPPDRSADGIGEVDADTYKVRRIINAGADPEQVDVSADGKRLYVANEDSAQVSVVDVTTGAVVTAVKIVFPSGASATPHGRCPTATDTLPAFVAGSRKNRWTNDPLVT